MKERILFDTVKKDLKSALIILDNNYHLVFSNERAEKLLEGIKLDMEEFTQKVLETKEGRERYELHHGSIIIGYSLEKVMKEGRLDRVVIVFQDITQAKAREAERTKREQKEVLGELALYIAHEVKNSLNLIRGYSQLMIESDKMEFIKGNLGVFVEETNRVNKLIHNILDYTKDTKIVLEKVNIVEFTREFVKKTYPTEGISVLAHSDNLVVDIDKDRVVQIYMNLIQNGLDAIEADGLFNIYIEQVENSIEVTFETDAKLEEGTEVDKLFSLYYTTKKDGNGLGLAICQKLMKELNGEIGVYKNFYEGLSFELKFPI